ncbi:methylmalonyl-CoA mutase [Rhodococcus oxybenzonivorans]|uniref:Methylmalonyl-CoA mutase n=1 Tax=Rhodococcus oxybenzonivorans TaxID=1990687 RepID=A0A2S2BZ71_9NOCA|nr:acyl-CoA mutase large subunit family protein [Rhodococcus oxybenzonivorans]AWK73883.1 methylmalonyl-CoA mutase [Rhodococcus oxybenzonivorans]
MVTSQQNGHADEDLSEVSVKLSRTTTWSGTPTENFYRPDEPDPAYDEALGDPGTFPYTRGSFPQMYRSRMWTLRNIVGYGSPEDTADGIAQSLKAGSAAVDVVLDTVSTQGLDPDHPVLRPDVGLEGASVSSINDLERLLAHIDITKTDVAWHVTFNIYPMVVAYARKHGLSLSDVHGSHMPDYLRLNLDGGGQKFVSPEFGHRLAIDTLEFVARNTPKWSCGFPQAYNLRERGTTPVGEIALGMAIVRKTFTDLTERGVRIDEVAPRMAWVSTADIDLFEEVAKFRALRRIWARTMKEEFGATDPRSMRLRIACHTSGRSLVYQQPLNNLTRAAIETLAAILGGVQSVETCTFDEPIGIPTHEARELATRTQLILAHEVGAARTADPLGGSYYVEALTDRVEADALALLAKIEDHGLLRGIEDGSIESMMDDENLLREEEIQSGERIVIGVNAFQPSRENPPHRFKVDEASVDAHVERFIREKSARDPHRLEQALRAVFDSARGDRNTQDAMADAFLVGATVGEVSGVQRLACGMRYDPFGVVESPFDFH